MSQYPRQPKDLKKYACATCKLAVWEDLTRGGRLSRGSDYSNETSVRCCWQTPPVTVATRPVWARNYTFQIVGSPPPGEWPSQSMSPLDDGNCPAPGECPTYEALT